MSVKKSDKKQSSTRLNRKQKQFIKYLADHENIETTEEFSIRTGIPEKHMNCWKANPFIVQSAIQLSNIRLGAEIPKVLNMLKNKALETKDVSACKLFFQQLDKVTDIPQAGITVDEAIKLINKHIAGENNQEKGSK